jgi:hypothetical protein
MRSSLKRVFRQGRREVGIAAAARAIEERALEPGSRAGRPFGNIAARRGRLLEALPLS